MTAWVNSCPKFKVWITNYIKFVHCAAFAKPKICWSIINYQLSKSLEQLIQICCLCRSSRWAGSDLVVKVVYGALHFYPPQFGHISVLLCPLIRQTVTSVQGGWSHSVTPHASTYRGRDYSLYASAPHLWQNEIIWKNGAFKMFVFSLSYRLHKVSLRDVFAGHQMTRPWRGMYSRDVRQ